jgi:hypothetical protein
MQHEVKQPAEFLAYDRMGAAAKRPDLVQPRGWFTVLGRIAAAGTGPLPYRRSLRRWLPSWA